MTRHTLLAPMRTVPHITLIFWVIKLCTTAMGEAASDFLVYHYNPYAAVSLGFVVFAGMLWLQLKTPRYVPWMYWATVLMVAIFGTMAADVTHVILGVPYSMSTITFGAVLASVLFLWQKTEGTLSVHSITTLRRELYYWATVLATFALGTAAGDLFAFSLGLGFLSAGIIFALIFALPSLGYRAYKWNAVFSFWFAYILTRPLGASFADWAGKSPRIGGLGWGDGPVAAGLFLLIIILVGYLQITHVDSHQRNTAET